MHFLQLVIGDTVSNTGIARKRPEISNANFLWNGMKSLVKVADYKHNLMSTREHAEIRR